jgi:truncated hemoglobin YjbI
MTDMSKSRSLAFGAVLALGAAAVSGIGCSSTTSSPAPAAGGTLYARLGGNAGLKSFMDTLVGEELKDPEIAAFFANAGKPGHPSAGQIKECLVLQLGEASGGPEKYPGTVSGGFTCRSMKDAHAALNIPASTFDKFVMIAGATAKTAKIADADIATIASVLNSTKPDIATGGDGGATTLYTRLGGNAGLKSFMDTLVGEELKDPEIAAFFANAGMPGHPSAAQIKECLVLQLGNASGGPETYPGVVSGGFQCRSMKAAHAALHIPASTFDKFVMIAGATAKTAGVPDPDITTIAAVLNSTKTDIVDTNPPTDAGAGG